MQSENRSKRSSSYDVQKIFETAGASKNETDCERLNVRDLAIKCSWSLFLRKKIITFCLLRYQRSFYKELSKCFQEVWTQETALSCELWQLDNKCNLQWSNHCLPVLSATQKMTLSTHFHESPITSFYTHLYEMLFKLIYEYWENERKSFAFFKSHQQESKSYFDSSFRCSSSNIEKCEKFFYINKPRGIEKQHQRCSINERIQKLDYNYKCLLVERNVIYCRKIKVNPIINNYAEQYGRYHLMLLSVVNHKKIQFDTKILWHYQLQATKHQLVNNESCHKTQNGIETTSNHKLKPAKQYHNDDCYLKSEEYAECYQPFYRRVRYNDSLKKQFNVLLFLVIICIQLLTASSSVHNLKYSTNIVKTKYGK